VGNDIASVESLRPNLRTPFERGIVVNAGVQSLVLDHALGRLGLADDGHLCGRRLALTDPPAMPLYARTTTTELAFEHYGVSALAYAVDGLLAADTMDAPPDRLVSE